MCKDVIIIGAGGHARVIADIIEASKDRVYGFLDDDVTKKDILGSVDKCLLYKDKYFIIAIGNNQIRKEISIKYPDLKYYTAIHPSAVISKSASLSNGTVVMANAVINADANIGKHCIINTQSVVEHNCKISDYVHISPGAILCGNVRVGEKTHIGAGAVVRNNINICTNAVIGCGGAVVSDIEVMGIYAGVPAKRIK